MFIQRGKNTPGVKLICHKCAYIKSPSELEHYGRYRLCLHCAQKFEELRVKDQVGNVEAYVMAE